ncbi:MAG: asparagine synthetase B family protein, partial [Gemmataceae bacterium]
MCGICGIFESGRESPLDVSTLKGMADLLRHRGPDDDGYYLNTEIGLGHRRLSIIDLKGGHQPLSNEDGSIWVAFNGEIYNFKEIRAELEASGCRFRSQTDTEVILAAYDRWGIAAVQRMVGMFAFAIWDEPKRRLWIVRDRLGKKPLLYARLTDGSLAFASETKALLRLPNLPRELDLAQLDAYLALQYVPRSGFRSVEKVSPGSFVVAEGTSVRSERYWSPRAAE